MKLERHEDNRKPPCTFRVGSVIDVTFTVTNVSDQRYTAPFSANGKF